MTQSSSRLKVPAVRICSHTYQLTSLTMAATQQQVFAHHLDVEAAPDPHDKNADRSLLFRLDVSYPPSKPAHTPVPHHPHHSPPVSRSLSRPGEHWQRKAPRPPGHFRRQCRPQVFHRAVSLLRNLHRVQHPRQHSRLGHPAKLCPRPWRAHLGCGVDGPSGCAQLCRDCGLSPVHRSRRGWVRGSRAAVLQPVVSARGDCVADQLIRRCGVFGRRVSRTPCR